MQLFFRLGTNANLAYAEIVALLRARGITFEVVEVMQEIAVMSCALEPHQIGALQNDLGGTIKIGEIVGHVTTTQQLQDLVRSSLASIEGKKVFGFSLLRATKEFTMKSLRVAGIELKKELGSARYVTSQEKELSSVIVRNEKLLTKGGEFILIPHGNEMLVGKTLTVQDFKAYERRDQRRPRYDARSGMLPVKVAQMMINLLGISDRNAKILDPFCGSGTILQELLVKGYARVVGGDISEKAIDDTQTNLEWLSETTGVSLDQVELYNVAAKELSQHTENIDGIVSEPYLGPPLRGNESVQQLQSIKRELEELYMRSFKTFAHILTPGARVVIILPVFAKGGEYIYLDIANKLKSYGFVLQTGYKNITDRQFRYPLMYYRPDAKVLREIMVFEFKG